MYGIDSTRDEGKVVVLYWTHALITPNFPSGSNHEIVGDYVKKWMLVHHFSYYYNMICRQMVSELAGVINPSILRMNLNVLGLWGAWVLSFCFLKF